MRWLGISLALLAVGVTASSATTGCYSTGDGTAPPPNQIYFPVGLAVSRGGNVMYVANSDFDLQWNGGTMQSYDLHIIRRHAVWTIDDPNNPNLPLSRPPTGVTCDTPVQTPPTYKTDGSGQRQPIGQTCAPPVDSSIYVRDSATIGAFATDLQLAVPQSVCVPDSSPRQFAACSDVCSTPGTHCEVSGGKDRVFIPVRGDASLTWADVTPDDPLVALPEAPGSPLPDGSPFNLKCGTRTGNRCDAEHHAGNNPNEPNNTRKITMPGEPFGMAQDATGRVIAITHQTDTKTSLFFTGVNGNPAKDDPSLQFVLDGLPSGGVGITPVPHDPDAFDPSQTPRPAFLQTSRASNEIDLLRYYSDDGSSLVRPFLIKESGFNLTANAGGTDSRGIVIDPTPRIVCKAQVPPASATRLQADVQRDVANCGRLPARVYFANRSPASILVGEIGEPSASGDGTYDPDRLVVFGNIPLSFGPSKLYLAPVVDEDGNYALRVFIVCFDSASIYVLNPQTNTMENIIRTGPGPFAMAFDPFDLTEVALRKKVPPDTREPGLDLKRYRFAYIASFTQSYVQVLDLDNSRANKDTFEKIVFTLGLPTLPKGTQ